MICSLSIWKGADSRAKGAENRAGSHEVAKQMSGLAEQHGGAK